MVATIALICFCIVTGSQVLSDNVGGSADPPERERPPTSPSARGPGMVSPPSHIAVIGSRVLLQATDTVFSRLIGAVILSSSGEELGAISRSRRDPKSLSNPSSEHGDPRRAMSILNIAGPYGCDASAHSAFNPEASDPPRILRDGRFVAYLTVNADFSPRVDPHALLRWLGLRRGS